jgi:tetratricopeptide (TPR) repeat protein
MAEARPALAERLGANEFTAVAVALLAVALYARGFSIGLVGDDYKLLDAALRAPLPDLLTGRHGILGYYRPVSRELYFWLWGKVLGFRGLGFHVVNAVTYAATVAMFHAFLRRWLGPTLAVFGSLAFVLFPPTGALLSWISCAQDLIALFWCAAALLLHQSRRFVWAGCAVFLAVLSKETAVVMPLILAAYDLASDSSAPASSRARRSWPAFAGLAVAATISIAVRRLWPAESAIVVWSPSQMTGAWRLPFDFLSSLLPPATFEGVGQLLHASPIRALLLVVLALATIPVAPWAANDASRTPTQSASRRAIVFGLAVVVLGMIPVGVVTERWRGYFFSLSALGSSVVIGALLARLGAAPARVVAALLALANYGFNGVYRPESGPAGPGRHPHVNFAFFDQSDDLSRRLVQSIAAWCPSFHSVPRTFVTVMEKNALLETVIGPALRVTCRDTVERVRFLESFTTDDARAPFGVLRFDPDRLTFTWQMSDPSTRVGLGREFLMYGRYRVAAAMFTTLMAENPGHAELAYAHAIALAASGRPDDARAALRGPWKDPVQLTPDTLAMRLASESLPPGAKAAPAATVRLTARVLADPADAAAHTALGHQLIQTGAVRSGTIEISIACGIGGHPDDLASLAEAYASLGALPEALDAYGAALARGLTPELASRARARMSEIERSMSGASEAGAPTPRP